jgi:hypothetical protein
MDIPDRIFDELVRQGKEEERREQTKIKYERRTMWAVIIYATIAGFQSCFVYQSNGINRKAANAAKGSADTAQKELEMSQRPWLKIEPVSLGSFTVDKDGATIKIGISITNVGRSIAQSITFGGWMVALEIQNPRDEQKTRCGNLHSAPGNKFGYVLFPEENLKLEWTFRIASNLIAAIFKFGERINDKAMAPPALFGCVSYQFGFEGGEHQTGFMSTLARADPANPGMDFMFILDPPTTVPPSNLTLSRDVYGNYAY